MAVASAGPYAYHFHLAPVRYHVNTASLSSYRPDALPKVTLTSTNRNSKYKDCNRSSNCVQTLLKPELIPTTVCRLRYFSHPCNPARSRRPWCDGKDRRGSVAWLAAPAQRTHLSPAAQLPPPADTNIHRPAALHRNFIYSQEYILYSQEYIHGP